MLSQLPPECPRGWSAQWSVTRQNWLYIDLKSLQSQWERPTESAPGHMPGLLTPSLEPSNGAPAVPSGWRLQWHDSYGAWFYTNSQTGKSQWNRPQYAAIPAIDYSPVDFTHKPTNWDQYDPTPGIQADHLQSQGKRHVPRLCIDTNYSQVSQRPVSPHYTFIPPTRPRAISDCPPTLPDIPISHLNTSHPAALNPFSRASNGFLHAPGAPSRQNRHSFSGGGYDSTHLLPSQSQNPPRPEGSTEDKRRKYRSWDPSIVVGDLTSLPTVTVTKEEEERGDKQEEEKGDKQEAIAPILTPPPDSTRPTASTPPPGHRPLSEIRQILRTETIGYTQGTWPVGAEDRGYYPTRVDEKVEEEEEQEEEEEEKGGYESDSSYSTEYAEDEDEAEVKERPPSSGFTPVMAKSNGREAWELPY